jgi:hypothetical protein
MPFPSFTFPPRERPTQQSGSNLGPQLHSPSVLFCLTMGQVVKRSSLDSGETIRYRWSVMEVIADYHTGPLALVYSVAMLYWENQGLARAL